MNVQNVIRLNNKDIKFSPASVVDDFGRIFFYENRIFRSINNINKETCLELLNSNLFTELIKEGYIPNTWISEFQLDGFELILEHQRIYESKPHHWSFSMFKEAALFILQMNKKCNQYGYRLKDAHPFNVFFNKDKPIFIDIGSIVKMDNDLTWSKFGYEEFVTSNFLPLLLWSKSEFFMARRLIEDGSRSALRTIPMKKVLDSEFVNILSGDLFKFKLYFRKRLLIASDKECILLRYGTSIINKIVSFLYQREVRPFRLLRALKPPATIEKKIKILPRPKPKSIWGDYHNTFKKGNNIVSSPRFERIIQIVKEYTPDSKTAIDLAGNQGVFSYLLSKRFKFERVILTDYDEVAIDKAFRTFKEQKIDIETYLFNFMKPLREEERYLFRSDIAFALAITHHLILTQGYVLPVIFDRISQFANKYVVIEFMPLGLWSSGHASSVPDWYNIDWFRAEFDRNFEPLIEEQLSKNRIVFVGRKVKRL